MVLQCTPAIALDRGTGLRTGIGPWAPYYGQLSFSHISFFSPKRDILYQPLVSVSHTIIPPHHTPFPFLCTLTTASTIHSLKQANCIINDNNGNKSGEAVQYNKTYI